jgi:hypothetical protein
VNPIVGQEQHHELLSDWSIYLIVLHLIGRSKMNEKLHVMTPNSMLLDVSVSPEKNLIKDTISI